MKRPSTHRQPARDLLGAILGIALVALCVELLRPISFEPTGNIPNYHFATDAPITNWKDDRLQRKPGESDLDFASRVTFAINRVVFHCYPGDHRRRVDRIAWGFLSKSKQEQGYLHPRMTNCGFCHQRAYMVARTLNTQGVNALAYGMNGHVVTLFHTEGKKYISDPDYGIGPIEYDNDLWSRAEPVYRQLPWVTPQVVKALEKPFVTQADDRPYYNMARLERIERRQLHTVMIFEAIVTFFGLLGFLLIGAAIVTLFDTKKGRDSCAE